jgi:chromosome segregation ATPase
MTVVLLPAVLLVCVATLAVAVGILRRSRRLERISESRYELLLAQSEQLRFLREERQMFMEVLDRRSRERQQPTEDLKRERSAPIEDNRRAEQLEQQRLRLERSHQQLKEELERERQGHLEVRRRAEQLEREQEERLKVRQEAERLGQERQQLEGELEREREERLEAQRQATHSEQERSRLEREHRRLKEQLGSLEELPDRHQAEPLEIYRLWRRKPLLVVGVVLGIVVLWVTSLLVALTLLYP